MSGEYFIDTNIFVYQLERLDIRKATIADELIRNGIARRMGRISFQVVQECLNIALRKAEITLTDAEVRRYMQFVLAPMLQIHSSILLYNTALDVQLRYRFSFYDSIIVAAALEAGCRRLYSEDMQHGQRIHGLTIENPFAG